MNNPLILVIDDEVQIRRMLEITLGYDQFEVISAQTAKEGMGLIAAHKPDLVILDLELPDENGHSLLVKIREWFTNPVIILSVQSNEQDIIKALDNGANDYLVKPFRGGELSARIRSALRNNNIDDVIPLYKTGNLIIDLAARTVRKNNEPVKLTQTEFRLLNSLVRQAGKVLTHQYLLREIWGPGYINQSQYLRVFMAQLRKKIEDDPNRPVYLLTESGVGYRFFEENV